MLEELKTKIKTLLDEAEVSIGGGKQAEADAKLAEVKTLRVQAETVKAVAVERAKDGEDRMAALEAEIKTLKTAPQRLPFDSGDESVSAKPGETDKAVYQIKYGEMSAAIKAVIADLYGADFHQKRANQMKAFEHYVRRGYERMSSADAALIDPAGRNILLRPDVVEYEIKSGRTVREIKATLEESSVELGAALVPEDYRTEIIRRLVGATIVRGRARVVTTTRDAIEWPKIEGGGSLYTSGVRVTWVDETPSSATVAATNPTFSMQRVPIHTVMARTDLSRNLMEDSAFNLLDLMAELFSEAMAIDEDAQFLTGTGGGTPMGVLGARANGNQQAAVSGINEQASLDASLLTDTGLMNLVYQLDAQYLQNAVMIAAKATYRDIRKIKDGEGRFVWQQGLAQGQPPTVLAYPAFASENMPSIAANNRPIIFGDWRGYVIADRVGMGIERVTDTTTTGTNTVAIFARRRLGGQVIAPWQFVVQKVSAT